jgi:hypothetical protein
MLICTLVDFVSLKFSIFQLALTQSAELPAFRVETLALATDTEKTKNTANKVKTVFLMCAPPFES